MTAILHLMASMGALRPLLRLTPFSNRVGKARIDGSIFVKTGIAECFSVRSTHQDVIHCCLLTDFFGTAATELHARIHHNGRKKGDTQNKLDEPMFQNVVRLFLLTHLRCPRDPRSTCDALDMVVLLLEDSMPVSWAAVKMDEKIKIRLHLLLQRGRPASKQKIGSS